MRFVLALLLILSGLYFNGTAVGREYVIPGPAQAILIVSNDSADVVERMFVLIEKRVAKELLSTFNPIGPGERRVIKLAPPGGPCIFTVHLVVLSTRLLSSRQDFCLDPRINLIP